MVEAQFSWDSDVEPVIRKYASRVFRGTPNIDELVSDAVSLGWEAWNAAQKRIKPNRFAYYACLRVKCERQFRQSVRSIETPSLHGEVKPLRGELTDAIATRPGDNPATIARLQVDFAAWLLALTESKAAYLECFLMGETTSEVAAKFGVSWGRVSQIRRELLEHWKVFTS